MASPDEPRVRQFCQELAAAGVARKDALEAVAAAWPTASDADARRSVCIQVHGQVFEVVHEERVKERSDYFRTLLDGPFRESHMCVLDVSELLQAVQKVSDAGANEDWATGVKLFLDVAEASEAVAARALLQNSADVCMCLRLLLLTDCFVAPSIAQLCLDEACQNRQHQLLHDSAPEREALICAVPWELMERLLAGMPSMKQILNLAGVWSRPAPEAQFQLRAFLASRLASSKYCGVNRKFSRSACAI